MTAPSRVNRQVAISAGSLAVLLGALDTYVVVTIMADIMNDLGIGINKIQQVTPIITWYLFGYIAAMPLLGRASDRFGRKLLLQVSLAGFALGSVITAMSTDLTLLVIGRFIQGTASGALLPVTLALAADLWASRRRAAVLGGVGAAQELGSVLGPVYGIGLVLLTQHWQSVFWVNVPLAAIAMVMIHFSLPSRTESEERQRVDVVGGLLLAVALAFIVMGLYNPAPDGKQILPPNGLWLLIGAGVVLIAFAVWEKRARTRLIDPAGVKFGPFLCALGASLTAGAALMVTLVDVELFGQGVLGKDQKEAAWLLLRFLIALPIGALLGGWIASRIGDRAVTCAGLLIAAVGYWLISHWTVNVLSTTHDLGVVSLPVMDVDLAIAGIGLGLVIGPLTSATLRVVPSAQHGIASAAVVVARMIGMLIGVASLSAYGLYRFHQILGTLPVEGETFSQRAASIALNGRKAYAMQYGEIFMATAIVCVIGAVLGLFIAGRHQHADEPGDKTEAALPPADAGNPVSTEKSDTGDPNELTEQEDRVPGGVGRHRADRAD